MKKLIALFGFIYLLVGCGNPIEDSELPYPPDRPYVAPQGNNGFESDTVNVLSFPFELSAEFVDENGDGVWQYCYNPTNKDDYGYRVDFVMHCNHTEDFDFINYPMIFNLGRLDSEAVTSSCVRFPDISSYLWYYVEYQPCDCLKHNDIGYNYEIKFPIIFPEIGSYLLCVPLMNFDDTDSIPVTLYNYLIPHFRVDLLEDLSHNKPSGVGGKVILMGP